MKTFTLIICISLIFFGNLSFGQNPIPNNEFENWSGNTPDGWDTSNENILGTDFTCVTRENNNPQSGQYSAKVQSVTHNIIFVGPVTMPGILTLGDLVIDIVNQTGTVTGGVPVSGYPKFLKGYYKYQPATGDSCIIGIGLTKWNGTSPDTIAYAYTKFGTSATSWQEFTIPIEYETFVEPDSMNIMFVSSNIESGAPLGGSTLWVDSLWIEYSLVSVNLLKYDRQLYISESAGNSSIILKSSSGNFIQTDIFSISGRHLFTSGKIDTNASEFNINGLTPGVYIIHVLFKDGVRKSVKFRRL